MEIYIFDSSCCFCSLSNSYVRIVLNLNIKLLDLLSVVSVVAEFVWIGSLRCFLLEKQKGQEMGRKKELKRGK